MKVQTRLRIEGRWDEFKAAVQSRWGEVSDDDLLQAQGDAERLVAVLKRRTGDAAKDLEREVEWMARRL